VCVGHRYGAASMADPPIWGDRTFLPPYWACPSAAIAHRYQRRSETQPARGHATIGVAATAVPHTRPGEGDHD
jgi:hypothetical protein